MAEFADEGTDARVETRYQPDQPIRRLPGRDLGRLGAQFGAQDRRDFGQPEEGAGADEPLPGRGGVGHGPEVQLGDVADVDEGEAQAGDGRHGAREQALDGLQ